VRAPGEAAEVEALRSHEGIGGELRLADFDALDLSNLNRITDLRVSRFDPPSVCSLRRSLDDVPI
jgi:molybdopterin/thiamine biosynthesis adenylyltransferase